MVGLKLQEKNRLEAILTDLGTSHTQITKILEDVAKQHDITYKMCFIAGGEQDYPSEVIISLISKDSVDQAKVARDSVDTIIRSKLPQKAYNRFTLIYATQF